MNGGDISRPLAEFQERARAEFGFLVEKHHFQEEPIPHDVNPYLNKFAVWFLSSTTRIVVEGINYGMNARVAVGSSGDPRQFENYDLGDLIALRGPPKGKVFRTGQLEQLAVYAGLLRDLGQDILAGDHAVFPALAECVEKRRRDYAAGARE